MTAKALAIADFLLARIAEDEYAAGLTYGTCFVGTIKGNGSLYDLAVRMGPARVVAECEAKRRIVNRAAAAVPVLDYDAGWAFSETLRDLVAVYADHPDYREEWRP